MSHAGCMDSPQPARPWVAALCATMLMQAVASFIGQILPVIAPLLTAGTGLRPESIGPLNGLAGFGTVLFLLFGGAILARLGPVRALQAGAALGALGLLVAAQGSWAALSIAALLLGISYGPTPPARSRILAATAPPRHRTLIFSVMQAGAPLGGALAGLLAAPVASWLGWQAALLLGGAATLAAVLVVQPLRARLDAERDPGQRMDLGIILGRANLAAPFRALRLDPLLLPLSLLGIAYAVVQGCLFTFCVTWLVAERGVGLVAAGTVFATIQGAGIVARILLGWVADRTGHASLNLVVQGFAAAAALDGFTALPAGAPLSLVLGMALLCGLLCVSWNGTIMAEIARLAPMQRVTDATSGSTLLIFLGYTAGPAGFAALVPLLGGFTAPFRLAALLLALAAVGMGIVLLRAGRHRDS